MQVGGTYSKQKNRNQVITYTKVHLHTWVKPLLSQDTDMTEDWREENAVKAHPTLVIYRPLYIDSGFVWKDLGD